MVLKNTYLIKLTWLYLTSYFKKDGHSWTSYWYRFNKVDNFEDFSSGLNWNIFIKCYCTFAVLKSILLGYIWKKKMSTFVLLKSNISTICHFDTKRDWIVLIKFEHFLFLNLFFLKCILNFWCTVQVNKWFLTRYFISKTKLTVPFFYRLCKL